LVEILLLRLTESVCLGLKFYPPRISFVAHLPSRLTLAASYGMAAMAADASRFYTWRLIGTCHFADFIFTNGRHFFRFRYHARSKYRNRVVRSRAVSPIRANLNGWNGIAKPFLDKQSRRGTSIPVEAKVLFFPPTLGSLDLKRRVLRICRRLHLSIITYRIPPSRKRWNRFSQAGYRVTSV